MIHLEVNCNFRTEPKCDCKISAWVIQSVAWGSIGLLVIKRIIYLFPQELHSVAALQSASSLQNKLEPFHALFYFPTVVYSGNVFQFYYEKKNRPFVDVVETEIGPNSWLCWFWGIFYTTRDNGFFLRNKKQFLLLLWSQVYLSGPSQVGAAFSGLHLHSLSLSIC